MCLLPAPVQGHQGAWMGGTGAGSLQRCSPSCTADSAEPACTKEGLRVRSFSTASDFTPKVKAEEPILALSSMKVCPREEEV